MNIIPTEVFANGTDDHDGWLVTWAAMPNGAIGVAPSSFVGFADRSIQCSGAFGAGGQMTWEGSNDGANFYPLTNPQGGTLVFTQASLVEVTEAVMYAAPYITGGDGTTSLTVTALFRRTKT